MLFQPRRAAHVLTVHHETLSLEALCEQKKRTTSSLAKDIYIYCKRVQGSQSLFSLSFVSPLLIISRPYVSEN